MSQVKVKVLREKSKVELLSSLKDAKSELMILNSKVKSGLVPDNSSKIKHTKKMIARIKTILAQSK